MRKSKLYRVGALFLAALMVITCMPQTALYVAAEEADAVVQQETEAEEPADGEEFQTDEEDSLQEETDNSSVQTSQENEEEISPNADDDPAPIPVTTITLDHSTLSIQRKESADLKYTLAPNNADEGTDVTFTSSNPTVAAVSKNGNVATVVANSVGKAIITAETSNGKIATCEVEVTPIPVKAVLIDPSNLTMEVGKPANLSVIVDPADADDTRTSLVTEYDSRLIDVDYVDATKTITVTPKKAGTTTLAVKSLSNPKIYGSCDITVDEQKVDLKGLSVKDGYPENLYVGGSINLTKYVTYNPTGATDKELTWSVGSGDDDYAEVNPQTGRVTAKWKEGDTDTEHEVSVIAASKSNPAITTNPAFKITIKRSNVPLKALHVTPTELVLEDAGSRNYRTISVQLEPLASTDREITAVVSGENGKRAVLINAGNTYNEETAKKNDAEGGKATAEADVNGRVYFTVKANELAALVEKDTCTITFTKKDADLASVSTIKARCSVTVNKYVTPVEKLELQESLMMQDGDEADLTAMIGPLTAEDRNIFWTVDDPEIASISDGRTEATLADVNDEYLSATVKIKANMVGTCVITATAAGDVKKTCKVTVKDSNNPAEGLTITSDGIADGETTEITLKQGQNYILRPEVTPDTASNKKVKWSSDSPSVASVEKGTGETGVVTANELGHCTITAQASGESSACTKTVLVNVVKPHMQVNYPEKWSYTPEDQPITETMLRENLQVFFWPVENPIPDDDKRELHDYELRILREDGKTEKIYTPDDMQKPGVKTLVIAYTYDGVTYKESVPVEMKEFDEADLISVTPLSGEDAEVWNVPNGTPASALPLAKTTEILVGRMVLVGGQEELKTAKMDAEIEWDVAASGYNSADPEAQEFTVFGNVVLVPGRVNNPNNVSRRVQAEVHVREYASSGKKTVRPSFSVLDGEQVGSRTTMTVPYGSKIVIETATDEAEIYYMVDRRPDEDRGVPQDEEHKYTSPIEITAKTTTIYAIAVKSGYSDSDCSECTFKLVQSQEIDPDDPDAPLPDDVTDEDREQIGGKVPDGLWAAVQMDAEEKLEGGFAYTGKAIKPAVHVYDRTMLLTEKTDYTLSYSNNTNAGSAKGSAKPPTITVTGKGNYEGKAVVYFTIKPQSIEDDSVFMDEYVAVAYNKKAQKPNPSLTWNGKKLTKNKDYTYIDASYTEPGSYKVTVEGTGNYTGKRTMDYEIYDSGVAVSKLTFSKVANQKYTGSEIRPVVEVKYKNTVLTPGTENGVGGNYWIKYENCTKVGTASLVIMGKGNYKGSKRINFKILPVAKISQAGITLDVPAAGVAYTGKPYTPKCTVNYLGTELKENKDYKLSYQNNTKAGTATVVLTGMGAYDGTAKKTFKILQNDISGLTAVMGTSFAYEKGGCKPKPKITYNGMELQEGTDYTLSYKNHNKIGNTASVTVKGKGNYKGQIVKYFEVTMQDISKLQVVAADKVYQNKKNIYKTKVQVIDLNGMALTAGTDYASDVYYTYESGSKAGQSVLSTDIIPVGTVIGVDVRVANPRCYQGTVHGTYRIVQANVSGAKVSISPQEYTGRSIRPKKSQIQVTLNGVLLGNDDYEIVGYENNVKQGNAKITIRGVGSYGGTKTATFKIKKKGILNLKF
ncbi:MAG: hypothetical protein HDR05_11860 [Lachnospiraceae bacterium]|nr:hypothetical protein [Lachnospiraceae bacterium]